MDTMYLGKMSDDDDDDDNNYNNDLEKMNVDDVVKGVEQILLDGSAKVRSNNIKKVIIKEARVTNSVKHFPDLKHDDIRLLFNVYTKQINRHFKGQIKINKKELGKFVLIFREKFLKEFEKHDDSLFTGNLETWHNVAFFLQFFYQEILPTALGPSRATGLKHGLLKSIPKEEPIWYLDTVQLNYDQNFCIVEAPINYKGKKFMELVCCINSGMGQIYSSDETWGTDGILRQLVKDPEVLEKVEENFKEVNSIYLFNFLIVLNKNFTL
mgnify:FL=1